MSAALRIYSAEDRRQLDREHAAYQLVAAQVRPANLLPEREADLIRAGAERVRHVLNSLDAAVETASLLDAEDRAATQHARNCFWCRPSRVSRFGPCKAMRRITRAIDRLWHPARRAFRRLERS
ncbi:MAG: hypothetical protein IT306_14610 [Chloroflexi bacterium]|nr:hypothetical protein [Chloroflexota bacterium]